MIPALMLDLNQDVRPFLGRLGLRGCVAVARPLFAGATAADGSVPDRVADPVTAEEVTAIRGEGLAFLPYANNLGTADLADPGTVFAKMRAAVNRTHAVGCPPGAYMGIDLEAWPVPEASLAAACAAVRGSDLGGSGLLYVGAASPTVDVWRRLRATDANVARALLWVAAWSGQPWSGSPPVWAPGIDDPAVQAWQFTNQLPARVAGSVALSRLDLSVLRLPLFAIGAEGLLLPDGSVGSPVPPDLREAAAALVAVRTALDAAQRALAQ